MAKLKAQVFLWFPILSVTRFESLERKINEIGVKLRQERIFDARLRRRLWCGIPPQIAPYKAGGGEIPPEMGFNSFSVSFGFFLPQNLFRG